MEITIISPSQSVKKICKKEMTRKKHTRKGLVLVVTGCCIDLTERTSQLRGGSFGTTTVKEIHFEWQDLSLWASEIFQQRQMGKFPTQKKASNY